MGRTEIAGAFAEGRGALRGGELCSLRVRGPYTATPSRDWDGLAGFVNYAFNNQWRISLRGEFLDDQGGFVTGTPEMIQEGTVTVGYSPIKSFELRLEARYDTSNQATFEYKTPDTDTFERSAIHLCDLIVHRDPRIGRVPKPRSPQRKK